jgi:hypothetical protein
MSLIGSVEAGTNFWWRGDMDHVIRWFIIIGLSENQMVAALKSYYIEHLLGI